MPLKNNRGVSLIELMMVAAMLGGLSFVAMTMNKQNSRSSVKYQFDTEVAQITNEINGILSNPTSCLQTIQQAAPALSFPEIKQFIPSPPTTINKYHTGILTGNSNLEIVNYNLILTGTDPDVPYLQIIFKNKIILKNQSGTNSTISKKVKLNIIPNGETVLGNITGCNSSASMTDITWKRVSGTGDIYYDDGNVGIGTATPTSKLNVRGVLHLDGAGGDAILVSSASSGGVSFRRSASNGQMFRIEENNVGASSNFVAVLPTALGFTPRLSVSGGDAIIPLKISGSGGGAIILQDMSGNVGIGVINPQAKLEVAGDLKIGNTTPAATTCPATMGGSMRYNSTSKIMEYCNESNWLPMGGGNTPGLIGYFNLATCPAGWIPANGTAGTVDLRGEFIRGWDNGRGIDASRPLGILQTEDVKPHTHPVGGPGFFQQCTNFNVQVGAGPIVSVCNPQFSPVALSTGDETRPRNIALLACQSL